MARTSWATREARLEPARPSQDHRHDPARHRPLRGGRHHTDPADPRAHRQRVRQHALSPTQAQGGRLILAAKECKGVESCTSRRVQRRVQKWLFVRVTRLVRNPKIVHPAFSPLPPKRAHAHLEQSLPE